MTIFKNYTQAYVWIWLPGESVPVVAGVLTKKGSVLVFNYGQSYLARSNKISIFTPELPLKAGNISPLSGLSIAGAIRDGAPDAWGRRVLINRLFGNQGNEIEINQLDELTYLLESGSDRIGALDFQLSPTEYLPRDFKNATLDELMEASQLIEKGVSLNSNLAAALQHGTAIGGARPKALINSNDKKFIAKFSSTSDVSNVVKAEFIAMRLAKLSGLNVANVELVSALGKDVILIERFDRVKVRKEWHRKSIVSALTLFKLDEFMARYASYEEFAEIIRHAFTEPKATLKEIFLRMTFNVLVGNTDDHARNHAAFYDGKMLTLTPAYDICPQSRIGNEASQAMLIFKEDRQSKIQTCLKSAPNFLLNEDEAINLIENQIKAIIKYWNQVCAEAKINEIDRKLLQTRIFLNPFIFENLNENAAKLTALCRKFKSQ